MSVIHWQDLAKQGVELRPRHELDFYPTNQEHVAAAFDLLPCDFAPKEILDPSMGYGVFGKEARLRYPDAWIVGIDVNPYLPHFNYHDWNIRGDMLEMAFDAPMFDLIISNPPYGVAESFVHRSLDLLHTGGWLVFLLRLSFAESVGRYKLFNYDARPHTVAICSDRPSFTGNGKTDASAYAYFCWQKGYKGDTKMTWVIADKVKAAKQGKQLSLFD